MKKTVLALSTLLAGCGGSSSSDATVESPEVGSGGGGTPEEEYNYGGTPSNPSAISLTDKNYISPDSFDNNFSFELDENQRLYFHATVSEGLFYSDVNRCADYRQKGSDDLSVRVNDTNISCSYWFLYSGAEKKENTLSVNYTNTESAYFRADIVADAERAAQPASGAGGIPSKPRLVAVGSDNEISAEPFFNYYAYQGKKGDELHINLYPDASLTELRNNCQSQAGGHDRSDYTYSHTWYGVSFDNQSYSCSTEVKYELEEDGTVFFHIRLAKIDELKLPSGGYFRIAVTPAG